MKITAISRSGCWCSGWATKQRVDLTPNQGVIGRNFSNRILEYPAHPAKILFGPSVVCISTLDFIVRALNIYRDFHQTRRRPIRHLFLFIGAEPNTDWLAGSGVTLDAKGFVLTGEDAGHDRHPLETNRRGVFAIGDVRSKSIKRVAAAVGEGAQVVAALHSYLA